jgi:GNAT superfamily N-acetyltransferase
LKGIIPFAEFRPQGRILLHFPLYYPRRHRGLNGWVGNSNFHFRMEPENFDKNAPGENLMDKVQIKPYEEKYKNAFYTINAEWLNDVYSITREDEKLLRAPEKIVASGGEVFFAIANNEAVGTCALLKSGDDEYELIKMGVLKEWRGKKLGESLMKAVVDFAQSKNAARITLETSVKLKPAVALYLKFGFIKTGGEYVHPLFGRVIFKMERNF